MFEDVGSIVDTCLRGVGGSDKCEVRWCLRCVCGLYSGVMLNGGVGDSGVMLAGM